MPVYRYNCLTAAEVIPVEWDRNENVLLLIIIRIIRTVRIIISIINHIAVSAM